MKAVIYARYSSHNQTEQSIEGQLRDNYAWAEQQEITVVGEYIDRALSGTKDTRPDFQRMIADASKKQFELVIVWKLDRFARNRYDSAIYKAKLKKYGVRVVSVKENITDAPEGIILEGLLESMAEYYSANLSQNILRGKRETMMKGFWSGGPVPLGYKVENRRLVVDEKTVGAVCYLFERYAAGESLRKIVDELNSKGYRTRRGNQIAYQSFSRTLRNPVYIGQYTFRGEVMPDLAERIIDDVTFQKVQEKIKQNAKRPASFKAKVNYVLRGKVFCGKCGYPMVGECGRGKGGVQYHYYACATRKKNYRYEDIPPCTKKSERKEVLENFVIDQTLKYVLTPSRIDTITNAVVAEYKKEFSESGITELEKELKRLEQEMNKLVDKALELPKAASKTIHKRIEEIGIRQEDVEAELARLKVATRIQITEKEVRAWLLSYCKGDTEDDDFRQHIVDTFINNVYVYENRVVVFYNVPGGDKVTYEEMTSNPELSAELECSDLDVNSGALSFISEHYPLYIFVRGVFGCVFIR